MNILTPRASLLAACMFLGATAACAEPLSTKDVGTYVLLGKDRAPTTLFYRLSQEGAAWKMEGKKDNGAWTDISCDQGCRYQAVPEPEARSYLPPAMSATHDIDCIKNVAQAFCRYVLKGQPGQGGHVVIVFVTGRPTAMPVKRVTAE